MVNLEDLREYFGSKKEVDLAYLFGSQANNTAGKSSDYDFAILLKGNNKVDLLQKRLSFMQALESRLRYPKVDVVILNQSPPRLTHQIIKNGKVVFQRCDKDRVAFETKAENTYLDHKYFYAVGDRYMLKRLAKGKYGGG